VTSGLAGSRPWISWQPLRTSFGSAAGCPVPRWCVTTDPDELGSADWVAKPLGAGRFFDGAGNERVVPATLLLPEQLDAVRGAPFLFQHLVRASAHARVVTVGRFAASATLSGSALPLDWRTDPGAHRAFRAEPVPDVVLQLALQVARACRVGFSSQDWVVDHHDQWWFLDLNPAGQWLFLPGEVADQVTERLADWLSSVDA